MWKKIGNFSIECIGVPFSSSWAAIRKIKYQNISVGSKISKISLSTSDNDSDPFRMIITVSSPKELQNLQNLFKDANLSVQMLAINKLYFDESVSVSIKTFFKVIQTFEPTFVMLIAELTRKYKGDYKDYPLSEAPPALTEVSLSANPRNVELSLLESKKCIGCTEEGRTSEYKIHKMKVG